MGGTALGFQSRRILKEEYVTIERELLDLLKQNLTNKRISSIPYYKNKKDFGDIDILIDNKNIDNKELKDILVTKFGAKHFNFNKNVISFDYKDFQVDLIFVHNDIYDTSLFYYSYNDLNNLVGRIAHKLGVKFGIDGLTYPLQDDKGNRTGEKVILTREPIKIYEFLGYEFSLYEKGFDELEDIYKFVISSEYFDYTIYQFENLNNINRTRDRKRKVYKGFLKFIEENNIKNTFPFNKDKSVYINHINNYFFPDTDDNFLKKLEDNKKYYDKIALCRTKFNGNIIMEHLPLEGKYLGIFIGNFKEHIVKKYKMKFNDFTLLTDNDTMVREIVVYYNNGFNT